MLAALFTAAFIEYNELTGEELWLEILLNGSVLFTVALLIKEIGPVRVINSVKKFIKKLSRTKKLQGGKESISLMSREGMKNKKAVLRTFRKPN